LLVHPDIARCTGAAVTTTTALELQTGCVPRLFVLFCHQILAETAVKSPKSKFADCSRACGKPRLDTSSVLFCIFGLLRKIQKSCFFRSRIPIAVNDPQIGSDHYENENPVGPCPAFLFRRCRQCLATIEPFKRILRCLEGRSRFLAGQPLRGNGPRTEQQPGQTAVQVHYLQESNSTSGFRVVSAKQPFQESQTAMAPLQIDTSNVVEIPQAPVDNVTKPTPETTQARTSDNSSNYRPATPQVDPQSFPNGNPYAAMARPQTLPSPYESRLDKDAYADLMQDRGDHFSAGGGRSHFRLAAPIQRCSVLMRINAATNGRTFPGAAG